MKKIIIYTVGILLVAIFIVTGTYAYFVFSINSVNKIITNSSKIDVIYDKDNSDITGALTPGSSYRDGANGTVKIRLANDSVDAKAKIYIYVKEIGTHLASNALKWELFRTYQGVETNVGSGTFAGVSNNSKVYVDTDYILSTEETSYTVYIWIDGSLSGSDILGESIEGYIGAEAEHITELK